MSKVWFESIADALETFKLGLASRQAAGVQAISLSYLRVEMNASAALRIGQADELNADNIADRRL